MGKNKKALSASDDVEDINISPLIDMVFILLSFSSSRRFLSRSLE
jgi:biopolymer transport protein ExbD